MATTDKVDVIGFINAFQKASKTSDKAKEQELLSLVKKHSENNVWNLLEDETILHVAIKMRTSCHVIAALVDEHPPLLLANRNNSTLYRGQTPLHIALTVGDFDLVDILLFKATQNSPNLNTMLNQCATGSKFHNTVMQGELPLSVAALTLNTKLLDKLLIYGANLDIKNSLGDNLCHSLIKYSHLYPEKCTDVMKMFHHIAKITLNIEPPAVDNIEFDEIDSQSSCMSHIWVAKNKSGFNPLKLAADLGQHVIFKFLMKLKHVYCHVNSEDGLFDVELYDVTDIDMSETIKPLIIPKLEKDNTKVFPYNETSDLQVDREPKVPTLEMIFKNDPTIVFKFIQLSPLRYVINRKWRFYRWFYIIWGILHMLFMIGYTVYAIRRTTMDGTSKKKYEIGSDIMVTVFFSLSILFAIAYLAQEIVRVVKGQMPWSLDHMMNCYHNGPFRLMLVMFSLTIIVDIIWKMADDKYRDYFLICSVILGWWFIVFFLRAFRQFSFFTVMIQKVLVGDMFRFSIIIGVELVAFTTGMLIAFREMNPPDETVQDFSKLMVQMFKMMFGFTSLDVLFDAKQAWLTVCLYVGFVLLTYVLMVNSLIAMMSNTCSVVSQNRELQYRLQQMSIILFFESIFPPYWIREVGEPRLCSWYDPGRKERVSRKRLFMEVRSLREVNRSKSRQRMTSENMLETIFNTLRNIQIPLFTDEKKETAEAAVGVEPVDVERTELRQTESNADKEETLRPRRHKKKKKSKKKDNDDATPDVFNEHVTENHKPSNITIIDPIQNLEISEVGDSIDKFEDTSV